METAASVLPKKSGWITSARSLTVPADFADQIDPSKTVLPSKIKSALSRPAARLVFSPAGCRGLPDHVRVAEVAGRGISGPAEGDSASVFMTAAFGRMKGRFWRKAALRMRRTFRPTSLADDRNCSGLSSKGRMPK
jgi:hypothetical protein